MPRARSPEAVAAGLEGHRDPLDGMAGLDGLVAPARQQRPQPVRIGGLLLERLAHHAGHQATSQVLRLSSTTATIVLS